MMPIAVIVVLLVIIAHDLHGLLTRRSDRRRAALRQWSHSGRPPGR